MSKCRNRKTGTEYTVFCIDDFFGRHSYGYDICECDEPALTEEQFNKHYELINESPKQ